MLNVYLYIIIKKIIGGVFSSISGLVLEPDQDDCPLLIQMILIGINPLSASVASIDWFL